MAKCGYCNTSVYFGGVKDNDRRFCNEECHRSALLMDVSHQMPQDEVREMVRSVQHGQCPKCDGPGPIDISTAYKIWSIVILTSWKSDPLVCCRSCGRKHQAFGFVTALLFGWWGFPWGLIMTPIQLIRNFGGLFEKYNAEAPSPEFENVVRLMIASDYVAQMQSHEGAQE